MTEKQLKFFYFPAWNRCARAMDWAMAAGRLKANLVAQRQEMSQWPEPARTVGLAVLDYAEQLARQAHRKTIAEDLRHGCNLAATVGRRSSSSDMDNRDVNRVAVLFDLLSDPDDLDAVMQWLHPEIAEKRSLVQFVRKCAHDGVICTISRNAFNTDFWEDLPVGSIKWILKQVKGRPVTGAPAPRREIVDEPF